MGNSGPLWWFRIKEPPEVLKGETTYDRLTYGILASRVKISHKPYFGITDSDTLYIMHHASRLAMRVNAHTAIVGETVILVPYRYVSSS